MNSKRYGNFLLIVSDVLETATYSKDESIPICYFLSNASSTGTVMGRHLPFYVPDSEPRNCSRKAKSLFYSKSPRSFRCFAQSGD